jgi:hypothetical protein
MLPLVGPDQAERIELAVVVHPRAVGVAKEVKAALPPWVRQPGLPERAGNVTPVASQNVANLLDGPDRERTTD